LRFSPNVIRVIKPKKRGTRHVKWKINKRKTYSRCFSETSKEKSPFEISRRRRVGNTLRILKQRNRYSICWLDSSRSKDWPVTGSCASENETSDCMNGEDFLVATTLFLKGCFMQLLNWLGSQPTTQLLSQSISRLVS
jgi:hypothetical protein